MSVREDEERKNTSTRRGLGLAAAAVGVGVGAALYYMFAKRQDDQQGQGTSNNDLNYEHEQNLDHYDGFRDRVRGIVNRSQNETDDSKVNNFRQRTWSLEECSICCDIMLKDQELISLPCSHNFHSACVTPWLNEHQTCPNCRKAA